MSGSRPVRKPRRFIVKVQLSFFTSEPCYASNVLQGSLSLLRELRRSIQKGARR